ncbi:unnamed protein product [Paramecium octaurelia]|uniref:RING-type domain-containing protein n=1 Tax=Paramecium octaurelia TaxID=43137 RepID=A0A8S1VJA3_PAROT|nr:unnamed protein product [Paramecium octaurelia]
MQNQKYQITQRSNLVIKDQVNEFECPICLDTLFQPVTYDCQVHTVCLDCVTKLQKCPLCRKSISFVKPNLELRKILNTFQCKCPQGCGQISYEYLYSHKINCTSQSDAQKEIAKSLMQIKDEMIKVFEIEINPHLKQMHAQIFDDFLTGWDWLPYKQDDWKWWWWCNTAWWNNQICQICNNLWHKYEDEIEVYEKNRLIFLDQI